MKGFKLDSNGDVAITNGKIVMIEDKELTRQTVQTVLGTNKGEWTLNKDEGIDFKNMLGKDGGKSAENSSEAAIKRYYEEKLSYERERCNELNSLFGVLERRMDGDI